MLKLIGYSNTAGWLAAILILLASTIAFTQETGTKKIAEQSATGAPPGSLSGKPKKSKTPPMLVDVTRMSTAEAAHSAALDAAKKQTTDQDSTHTSDGTVESDVIEFRPAAQEAEHEAPSPPSISTKPARKNIHGTVSGSLDPRNARSHQSEASVGLGTRSGRAHVYVETDQSRSSLPPSH